MQPAEQAAQPRDHSSKHTLNARTRQNICPQCGDPKRSIAKTCVNCYHVNNRPPVIEEVFWEDGLPYRKLPLTRGCYALVDAEDYQRLSAFLWHYHKDKNALTPYAAASGGPNGTVIRMHRFLKDVSDRLRYVDHRDGNGLNNRKRNLRVCPPHRNSANRRKNKNNTSGFRGVFYNKRRNRYVASICAQRKAITIGYYKTAIEAARARDLAAIQMHGDFAVLNFPRSTYGSLD